MIGVQQRLCSVAREGGQRAEVICAGESARRQMRCSMGGTHGQLLGVDTEHWRAVGEEALELLNVAQRADVVERSARLRRRQCSEHDGGRRGRVDADELAAGQQLSADVGLDTKPRLTSK